MKCWKSSLLMVFTVVAVILALSVPAIAEEVEIACEADGGVCKEHFTYEEQYEDDGLEPEEDVAEEPEPVIEGSDEECYPFCGLEWWPY